MIATKTPDTAIATANEPSAALMWPASTRGFIRAKRLPISAPIPTRATLRTQGGRPPSTRSAPCSTLEAIIAPNIQLAGNFRMRRIRRQRKRRGEQRHQLHRRCDGRA